MSELELKFKLDDFAVQRWRERLKAAGARRIRMRALYFDTADGKLSAAEIALRVRQEGRRWVQTLKASGDSAVNREEHEVSVSPGAAGAAPAIDPDLHRPSPVFGRLQRALQHSSDASLSQRYATDFWRTRQHLRCADGSEVEAALDLGIVIAGEASSPIAELELEHKAGPVQGLFDLAVEAVGAGGLWLSTVSKAEQGEQLSSGRPVRAVKARPLLIPDHADGPALLRAVLANASSQVLSNASLVAAGSEDGEVIHQLRVGLRRLRTALRELDRLSERIAPAWEDVLGDTFGKLGQRRDNEEVGQAVQALLLDAAAPKPLWTAPPFANTTHAVRHPAFQSTLLQILALVHSSDDAFLPVQQAELKEFVADRLHKLCKQVLRDGRHFDKLATDRQHRVRKRLKRLRYLAEFVRPLWPAKAVDRFIDRLKPAQEALGHHNDCVVACELFRHDALTDPRSWFAVGFLQAHLAVTQRAAAKALRRLDKAEPFWS